jgi:hypothetical protein
MPVPLSDALLESLKDPTTALAAAFVIARWHPEHIAFAARAMAGPTSQGCESARRDDDARKPTAIGRTKPGCPSATRTTNGFSR